MKKQLVKYKTGFNTLVHTYTKHRYRQNVYSIKSKVLYCKCPRKTCYFGLYGKLPIISSTCMPMIEIWCMNTSQGGLEEGVLSSDNALCYSQTDFFQCRKLMSHMIIMNVITFSSLVPRPHPQGGKVSGGVRRMQLVM